MTEQVKDGSVRTLALPMDLTIAGAHALHGELRDALAGTPALALDARQVDRCDTAGIQLLIAAHRYGEAHQQPVTIVHPTPQLINAAAVLGLADTLGLPHPESVHA